MQNILFVKTSSLGDVVHQMPAMSDVRSRFPQARLSWIVEEAFAPLARLHPGVDEVMAVSTRRWRSQLLRRATWNEIAAFRAAVRSVDAEIVIDTQGLVRSALIARMVHGERHGYDRASIREPLACPFYDVHHQVEWKAHAIPRNRTLCGLALGYEAALPPDYGLDRAAIAGKAAAKPYAVLIHGTAQPGKLWPQAHWTAVARAVRGRGCDIVRPWGSVAERSRSEGIAQAAGLGPDDFRVPDRLPLDAVAALIAGASAAIGVDTGLVHIAAALGVALVAIFIDSEPGLTGPMGRGPIAVIGGKGASPSPDAVLRAFDSVTRHGPP